MTVGGILQRILNFESFSVLIATIALGRVIYILHPAVRRRGGGGSAAAWRRRRAVAARLHQCLLHQLGRWRLLGLDLPTYGERTRAVHH
jgi:hypothetical protein